MHSCAKYAVYMYSISTITFLLYVWWVVWLLRASVSSILRWLSVAGLGHWTVLQVLWAYTRNYLLKSTVASWAGISTVTDFSVSGSGNRYWMSLRTVLLLCLSKRLSYLLNICKLPYRYGSSTCTVWVATVYIIAYCCMGRNQEWEVA